MNVPIVPDDKDWTWVLERPCPECGFDVSAVPPASVAPLSRANAAAWAEVLRQADDVVRRRPAGDRWAPLEYACHVRDVCALYQRRLDLMLREDDPLYANWVQDATAVEEPTASRIRHGLRAITRRRQRVGRCLRHRRG